MTCGRPSPKLAGSSSDKLDAKFDADKLDAQFDDVDKLDAKLDAMEDGCIQYQL